MLYQETYSKIQYNYIKEQNRTLQDSVS